MEKLQKLFIFTILILVVFIISYFITLQVIPSASVENIWFYSGIVMVLVSQFFIEPYFSAPSNVTINSLSICLILLSIKNDLIDKKVANIIWIVLLVYNFIMFILSFVSYVIKDNEKSGQNWQNKISDIFKYISTSFGKGEIVYSVLFLSFILLYHEIQNVNVLILILFWWLIIVIKPQNLILKIKKIKNDNNIEIGEVIGVQSKKMFLAKLYIDRTKEHSIKKFEPVSFLYSMREEDNIYNGIVFDKYLLNQQKWIKILFINSKPNNNEIKKENIICKMGEIEDPKVKDFLNRFIGIVTDQSDIDKLIFEYSTIKVDIQEGDLLEVEINKKKIFYQISNAKTISEVLEYKNENGYIRGEALQLGTWNEENICFEKYGWVPEINTPILFAEEKEFDFEYKYPLYRLGNIPKTSFPSLLDLNIAVSHHIGILGITGSGKTFISQEIIKELISETKVICVDFTGEWGERLKDLSPINIIKNKEGLEKVECKIAALQDAKKNNNSIDILKYKKDVQSKLYEYIEDFLKNNKNLAIFELPDLSNTSFILEFTQLFLDSVFNYAKENSGKNICIVIEEAHTVVPETNSLGDLGDYGSNKALVNKIGQIALQGRKYGVGFMIIAQRTANVSKTVLTQCNTMICFKAYDKTSSDFLANYFGENYTKLLPNLKPYHAIVSGKAFKSPLPMIVDLTRD